MGPGAATPGIPFPGASSGSAGGGGASGSAANARDTSVPRSATDSKSDAGESLERRDMDIDDGAPTPTKKNAMDTSGSLPSIKNLFGIERAEPLASVRRTEGTSDDGHSSRGTMTPSSPAASHPSIAAPGMPRVDERGLRGHSSSNSFSGFQSGSVPGSSSSSLGPIRTRHLSNTGSYGRSAALIPSTPPRHGGSTLAFSPEDPGRRRADSRSRQAQALKGLILSPPSRRAPFDHDGASDFSLTPQRHSGHRPASSSSGSLSTMFSHISTASDPAPMLPPNYPPSTHTSVESGPHDSWGAASSQSTDTSPRTSWHSRSSTMDSGESAYKMMGSDRAPGPLLPPFRESIYTSGEPSRRSPEWIQSSSLSRHRSLRTPGASADLPSAHQQMQRPRARTLTHADRPIAPLPNSDDPLRRQRLEAASELLRMGQQRPDMAHESAGSSRVYSHKHSMSMQERAPLPMELYENANPNTNPLPNLMRSHRPKAHSMSGREPFEAGLPPPTSPHQAGGMYSAGPGSSPYERGMPPGGVAFDSFHPRRGRGAADDAMRPMPGGAGWVFPRRPVPADSAEAQRSAFQAQMLRGHGLASVPDGIISGHPGMPGGARAAGTTGTIASGQAKYECAWCGKRFSRPSSLKIHHHSHTGEKPFVCNEPGCGRSFSVQSNLRRHQKCHAPGGDQSEAGSGRSQAGSSSGRGDDEMWNRGPGGPPPSASTGARMSPINAGPPGWHQQYGHPHHGHGQAHLKDHPPLSRSAYEPGSRSMNTWSEMRRDIPPPPGFRGHEHEPGRQQGYGTMSSPRRFTQMRERRLSESSVEEEDELELDEREEIGKPAAGPARVSEMRSPNVDTASSTHGPPSDSNSDEEHDKTITALRNPRPRSATNSSTTSNIRAGFHTLLNPSEGGSAASGASHDRG